MSVSFVGNQKLCGADVVAIDVTTWDGPLVPGEIGRHIKTRMVAPKQQTSTQDGRRIVINCVREREASLEHSGSIANTCSGFDALAAKFTWVKPKAASLGR